MSCLWYNNRGDFPPNNAKDTEGSVPCAVVDLYALRSIDRMTSIFDSTPQSQDSHIEIPLTKGHVAIIDGQDSDLQRYSWFVMSGTHGYVYAHRSILINGVDVKIAMHREIAARVSGTPIPIGMVVDHINRITLDNRRSNLRIVTQAQNAVNRNVKSNNKTGFTGVYWNAKRQKFEGSVHIQGKNYYCGSYDTPQEASAARLAKIAEFYGDEFAYNEGGAM